MVRLLLIFLGPILIAGWIMYGFETRSQPNDDLVSSEQVKENAINLTPQPSPSPAYKLQIPSTQKTLVNNYHVFQSFNNCGPAALSMALSFYGINKSQVQLGQELRPYQVPGGNNDDKSVTLEELAEKAKDFNLLPYHRPNGSIDLVKLFITYDIPVITRTWLKENEDIGHYRIIKGYNEINGTLVQDDSLQGKNLIYTYDDFNVLWEKFNFEYLVLVSEDKKEIAEAILGENVDANKAWQKAAFNSLASLKNSPDDIYSRFNLSVAYHNIGEYQKSVDEFEKVENRLSFRTLWYQIEPIESYYELGDFPKVLAITERVLNNQNRAFSELYLLRGNVYLKQNNLKLAKLEFEKAVLYNKTFITKVPAFD